jgi:NADH-quinone oxidoreductase subunit B
VTGYNKALPIIDVAGAAPRTTAAPGNKHASFEFLTTRKDELVGWARKFSLFPYPFVTACCAMEFMAVSGSAYDTDRFGAALPRFSPRQADLLMVVGTVTQKQAPILLKVYEQMCEPKWVMAFGVCASTGGFYQNYASLPGIDRIIPVDVYVPGCPPRPEMVIDGIMRLQESIARGKHPIVNESF